MQDITLRQLRAITAVAETGKIISAAKALHVTAPAVTMQIKQVEDSIGMPMFERSDGLLRPTDAGAALVRTASRVEAELRDCAEALADLTGLKHGSVSVGVVSTAKYFAPRMLAAFAQTYPSISLRLAVANRSETLAALEDHRFDVF
ncbi:MAG: LysR family transcriptional regulator, partial [Hyphomicrobiaceae bacterium]|nr:LysR family transcriptional regulator [Hyphomicrobiaceae bacterium]